ncbi:Alpha/Beta hydrolase protein [Pterulicium gracile]|uniref:Carboxylic ester hydrolase n=1 Tax=Pterulicium gracile TaxID=1884261 RepID=A0A5C3QV87_9AGAR|nr:Alpha/Beta hydrolase protein [Pterula gracilis]
MGLKPLLRLLAVTSAILHVLALVPSSPTRRDVNADGLDERARHDAVVDLGYAKYLGVFSAETDVTNFLGVRFAAAPEGDLRWQAPQPPTQIEGIQDASRQPPLCHQGTMGGAPTSPWLSPEIELKDEGMNKMRRQEHLSQSEDCLFLNVHVPRFELKNNNGKRLPVVVWIHGGGYMAGNAAIYDGTHLVHLSNQRVIAVVLQHRLGLFGFLSGNEVKNRGKLNAGLLDQEFALKWVQEHIHKFGGDPKQVTIWGESAGAGSVLQHIVAHDGKTSPPLFKYGITSSAFLPPHYAYDHTKPQTLYEQVVARAGCGNEEDTLTCLRSTDPATLAEINIALLAADITGSFAFAPVIDGEFSTQSPSAALRQGKTNGVGLLAITNSDEGYPLVLGINGNLTLAEYTRNYFHQLSVDEAERVAGMYEGPGKTTFERISQIQAEAVFVCPSLLLLDSFTKSRKPAWKGQFAVTPGWHAQDVSYYFKGLSLIIGAPPVFEADGFVDSFARPFLNFAVLGDPNTQVDKSVQKNPHWPQYQHKKASLREMYFGQSEDGERADVGVRDVDSEGLLERCRVWAELVEKTAQ